MKRFWKYVVIACCAAGFACVDANQLNISRFNRTLYAPKYAQGFEIRALPDSSLSLIVVSKPWQGSVDKPQYLVVDNINNPIDRVICLSSSNIAMIEQVDKTDAIVGVSGVEYISNKKINQRFEERLLADVGYGTNLDFETIVALRPDLVLLYGVEGEDVSVTNKLNELKIKYIYIGDYAEQSPLGKAEWMVALAEIFGKRGVAIAKFGEIESRYVATKERVELASKRPRVIVNTPYREVWYMPSSKSYIVQLIEDAGGEYIYKGNNSNSTLPIAIETAYTLVNSADIWLNLGATITSREQLIAQNPLFAKSPVVERSQLYNTTARRTKAGGSDFWESGVVRPDIVLSDLVKIIHPELSDSTELFYYQHIK